MTLLLVSVRNAEEADAALAGGADLIDVKEPAHGSLGAASAASIQQVIDRVAGRRPVSAACGELRDWTAEAARAFAQLRGLSFAKIGTSFCESKAISPQDSTLWEANPFADGAAIGLHQSIRANAANEELIARWQSWHAALPAGVAAVDVLYADLHPPMFVPNRVPITLVDTFNKSHGSLFAHWSASNLTAFCNAAHSANRTVVVAGSLQLADLAPAIAAGADIIAVRTAACRDGRTSPIDAGRVRELKVAIEAIDAQQSSVQDSSTFLTPSPHSAVPPRRQTLPSK